MGRASRAKRERRMNEAASPAFARGGAVESQNTVRSKRAMSKISESLATLVRPYAYDDIELRNATRGSCGISA